MSPRLVAAALVSIAVIYGCGSSNDDAAGNQNEDQLILRKGSVDQAGLVEATTMMLGAPTDSLLDAYNESDPFGITGGTFAPRFAQRLGTFDAIDGTTDWQPDQVATWTSRLAAGNYIVIDTDKPCNFDDPHTYLEIERAQLTGREHTTCGGRMPNEDALDVTLNFLARGPGASVGDEAALHDGVDQATTKSANAFPYLGEMNGI
jgi:hypothetical protein